LTATRRYASFSTDRRTPRHTCVQTSVGQAPTQWAKTARRAPLIGLLLLLVSAVPVRAATFTFTAVLTSGQEPPPTHDSGE
jgi:hypothetical protein